MWRHIALLESSVYYNQLDISVSHASLTSDQIMTFTLCSKASTVNILQIYFDLLVVGPVITKGLLLESVAVDLRAASFGYRWEHSLRAVGSR